jgi:phage I-like protein
MPIPEMSQGESEKDFMSRCMGDSVMVTEYPDESQRAAICMRQTKMKMSTADYFLDARPVPGGTARITSDWQMIMPIGLLHTVNYGDVDLSTEVAKTIVENYNAKVMAERQPYIDTDHDMGPSNGWITEMKLEADGIYGKVKWTTLGEKNVGEEIYKYFSPTIGKYLNPTSGETISPVMLTVSLTNIPQADMMPPVHLNTNKSIHSNALNNKNPKGEDMNFDELKKVLTPEFKASLKPEELKELSGALGIDVPAAPVVDPPAPAAALTAKPGEGNLELAGLQQVVNALDARNKELTEKVAALMTKDVLKEEEAFIQLSLSKGKITDVDVPFWRNSYRTNAKLAVEQMGRMPEKVDFSVRGTGAGGNENITLSAAERDCYKKDFHLTDAEIDERILGIKAATPNEKK